MNKVDLARIGCKLLSLYLVIRALSLIEITFLSLNEPSMRSFIYVIPSLLYLLLAALLWFRSTWIASKIVKETNHPIESNQLNASDVQSILFSLVGLLILSNVIPNIVQIISQAIIESKILDSISNKVRMTPQYIAMFVKLFIGIWLLFGYKGLVRLIRGDHIQE